MSKRFGFWSGCIASVLAVVSAVLSIAPFTPAVVLTAVAIPAAVVASWSGAWRLGVFSFFWSVVALLAFPTLTPPSLEAFVGLAYLLGAVLGAGLYLHYRNASAAR